ncbi:little elongation complex subunit 1 [Rhinoderma darwinii]|uniref:little elongation complex subunit 1 n=1 Tax=Rhinoderma darwinii TaxID=43563 RepID=UPI003F674B95
MMPGETHSKTAGIASEAAGSCHNCTSLQQSLNEYVAALIALKQKIIDSDQLLAEYQQKSHDLQYAERENETLRCQLEQMLQKMSSPAQHEEELKSLKAELEEKTSSLKIYQQTQMEYTKVKEECEKSEITKKKLEAKLKRMEEAAAMHDKDSKQLKKDKKVITKELKKIQKNLDGFQSEKGKKVVMKNAQTQVAREEPVVKLDKQKIKYLLEEIWGCIESSTENGDCNLLMLGKHPQTVPEIKVIEIKRRGRKAKGSSECERSPSHSLEIRQTCNTLAELDTVQASFKLTEQNYTPHTESAVIEYNEEYSSNEDANFNILVSKDLSDNSSVNSDVESDGEEIWEVQDWAKPLPNLLSPIQGSPITIENVFGEFSDSSDAETNSVLDQSNFVSQLKTENKLENGTDKNRDWNEGDEHILVATANSSVKTSLHSNDGPVITTPMEPNMHNLEETTHNLPLSEAQTVTEEPIHMKYEDRSDHHANGTTCSKESQKVVLKNAEPELLNPEFYERPLAEIKNGSIAMDVENEFQDTAEKDEMQLNSVSDSTTGQYHETVGCFIANNRSVTDGQLVHCGLNPDKDMSISMGNDQETVLHMQSGNCSEKENSSLMDLHSKQNMSGDASTHTQDVTCPKFSNAVDVDLSKCSEENLERTLDTTSNLHLISKSTEETEQLCIMSTEKNDPGSVLMTVGQSQSSETLGQTSSLLSSDNLLPTVSDSGAPGIDYENIRENTIYDKSRDMYKITETHLEVISNTTDKQNIMAITLNKEDFIISASTESQCKTIDEKQGGLENCSSQKEKLLEHEPEQQDCLDCGMDKMVSTSVDNKHKSISPAAVDPSSLGLNVPVSPADLKTSNEDFAYSSKLLICADNVSPPSNVHVCTPCVETSTENPSHDLEKPNLQTNLRSVVRSSPVRMAVDPEYENQENLIKAQCQEVTLMKEPNLDLNSSVSEHKNTVLCPIAGLIPVKSSSVVLPVPLEELQHLQIPSESNHCLNEFETDTIDPCDISLDSSDSEYEFPVRKVNFTRPALNNSVQSFKMATDATKDDHTLLSMTKLRGRERSTLAHAESEERFSTVPLNGSNDSIVENDFLRDSEHSVSRILNTESKNDTTSKGNAVECFSDGKSKDTTSLQDPVRQNDVSDHIHSDNDAENLRSNAETGSQRLLPGKNFIWNFSRPDDFVDPRAVCLTRKQKTNSENVCATLENSVSRGSVSTGKIREHDTSNKLKASGFQTVRNQNPLNAQVGQTVLANADTSTNTGHSPETINKVRSEMGPPLPPLLAPLLPTPPRSVRTISPIMSSSSRSSLPSPLDELISPMPGTPFLPLMSPLCDGRKRKSPVFNTPSPAEKANQRLLSSPLQFCAATPKHAVPVPGRLPLSANGSSACKVQENSVKILDTMYPELSARARTLNILKGNVQLNRGMTGDGQNVPVSQITGFKSITSTSTVFIKTGSNSKTSNKEKPNTCESQLSSESCTSVNKRAIDAFQMPKSAKRLRLDSESPIVDRVKDCFTMPAKNLHAKKANESCPNFSYCGSLPDIVKDSSVDEDIITNALKKVEELCFDLLPVIRSHVHVGTIPNVPVMRNEEKEVIYDFSSSKKGLADRFLHVLLKKIKTGKRSLDSANIQALCRVYVGLCRRLGDLERARILCYSILKEGFQDPDKLLLFVISSWNDILSLHGVVSKAIQAVLKILAKEDVGSCLSAYLNWEKSPPMNVSVLLNSVLMAIQLYPDVKFHESEKYGEDLTDNVWEYVFAVDLLCSHRKWIWTHENVISKELWPILDKWVKRKKGNLTLPLVPDIIVATVLRLIGHLCQMGLKEGFITAVKNITSVIITFIKQANEEGVPWGVQLASVYMLCDTAPCDPALIHQTLQAWKETTKNNLPPAVINRMQEIVSLCAQDK